MPYVVETWDKIDHQLLRKKLRQDHLDYLNQNLELLLACGAKLDDNGQDLGGGIYIIDVASREAAQKFIEQDPFYIGGALLHKAILEGFFSNIISR
ncbi:YCII-related domain protein [Acinetobacter sp. 263903-1]|uniref:YciI family protein n=1 Tax=Acinetobacter sp. 263903-1 TaxID=1310678 RepID=UPI00049FCFF6|nr:YciI family protein [Acinetobacter sp. 263903-1]KCX36316.1 YCII-related domain protein [Acinetobacter sp. 263903-1]